MPQQFKHFNIFMVSTPGLYNKKMALPSWYQLILFSLNLNIFQWEGNKINCFTWNSVSKCSGCRARLINHSSEFQLQLALEGSYVNGNCTEDVDCKENMPASQLSREWSVGQLKINLQTPVNLLKIYATLKMYPTIEAHSLFRHGTIFTKIQWLLNIWINTQ